jgi:hypothetical protein
MAIVTSINLFIGGPAVHVTVDDQNGNPLSPAFISWMPISGVSITADTTGFLFTATTAPVGFGFPTMAQYMSPGIDAVIVIGPTLTVNIQPTPVTALEYTSP